MRDLFLNYLKRVVADFQEVRSDSSRKPLHLHESSAVRGTVERLEETQEFRKLGVAARHAFDTESPIAKSAKVENEWVLVAERIRVECWQRSVGHFFRRSSCYLDAFDHKPVDQDSLCENFFRACRQETEQVTHFALMEGVSFSEADMDFREFGIRTFTASELERIVSNRNNSIFYPEATLDLNRLQEYWFITCVDRKRAEKTEMDYHIPAEPGATVRVQFSQISEIFRRPVRALVLYDWATDSFRAMDSEELARGKNSLANHKTEGWQGFRLPVAFEISDNLLQPPKRSPDLSMLKTEFVRGDEGDVEIPFREVNLSPGETESFKKFVCRWHEILSGLKTKENGWQFFELALDYLTKAFFTEGIEQLLWHMIVIEALIGEKQPGLTERLASRLSNILKETNEKPEDLKKCFKKLYDLRCDLVHGKRPPEAWLGHLRKAREVSRRTLLWFLQFLAGLQQALASAPSTGGSPTRKDILTSIDLEREDRARLQSLIGLLPDKFPSLADWNA